MNPELAQPPQADMSPDQAAAALSFATMLSDQMIPKNAPGAPQEATGPAGETPKSDTDTRMEELETRIFQELDDIKELVEKDDTDDVESIKKQLEAIINE